MYYDFSINSKEQIHKLAQVLKDDGFKAFALNHTLTDSAIQYPFKDLATSVEGVRVLRRVTLQVSEPKSLMQFGQNNCMSKECDLIAIRPLSQKIFATICKEYHQYDIISFDASQRLPFMLRRNQVQEALEKGISFQLCYQSALSDPTTRRTVFSNLITLFNATKGRNTLVSSGIRNLIFHRSYSQVISMLCACGIRKDRAYSSVSSNMESCLSRSKFIRTFKGTIQLCSKQELEQLKAKGEKRKLVRLSKLSKMEQKRKKIEQNLQ